MREFWDARAREDAFFFVDDTLEYGRPDLERFWRTGEEALDTLLGAVGASVGGDDVVVDLGCGIGRLTRVLAGRARHVHAIDVSGEMLDRARELNADLGNVEWVLGDGSTLDGVEDASCDVVISHAVLQHIPDPQVQLGYVAEFARVLKPGGWAAFGVSTDPGAHAAKPPAAPAAGSSRRGFLKAIVGQAPTGKDQPEWLGSWVPLDALGAAAMNAGLLIERIEGSGTKSSLVRAIRD